MLKLKKVQILGFKSFCDRTELKFPGDGIAAIVGPNGCGKSNISDAIAWVLGEQSAKTLRGVRMEDVIFAGTRDRKPTGMAEVTLHLIDPEDYEGGPIAVPEIEIRDEMPGSNDDWDEAAQRQASAEEVEEYIEEVRPGQTEERPAQAETSAPNVEPSSSDRSPIQVLPPPTPHRSHQLRPVGILADLKWCFGFAVASSRRTMAKARLSSPGDCSAPVKASISSTASSAACATSRTSSWARASGRSRTRSSSRDASGRS